MVRNTYIYPPGPSMRIVGDIFEYTAKVSIFMHCFTRNFRLSTWTAQNICLIACFLCMLEAFTLLNISSTEHAKIQQYFNFWVPHARSWSWCHTGDGLHHCRWSGVLPNRFADIIQMTLLVWKFHLICILLNHLVCLLHTFICYLRNAKHKSTNLRQGRSL